MATTHRVQITDLRTGKVVTLMDVDVDLQGSNAEESLARGDFPGTDEEWEARIAAWLVAPEICPFDCDHCRGD